MRVISAKELSNFKILPYDLYSESNQKILSAGEVLTPGKLIMLKNYSLQMLIHFLFRKN